MNILKIALVTWGLQAITLAQPIITQQHYPVDGEIWEEQLDTNNSKFNITAEGPSQTWDYSTGFVANDTVQFQFVSANKTPANWYSNFPNANLAIYSAADSTASYYISADSGFFQDGMYIEMSGSSYVFDLIPAMRIVKGNLAYGDTFVSKTISNQLFYNGQMTQRWVSHNYRAGKADAWGTLKTVYGNFSSVLRSRYWEWSVDTTYIDSTGSGNWEFLYANSLSAPRLSYEWYTDQHPFFLMGASIDYIDHSLVTDLTVNNIISVGINNSKSSNIRVYPNPTNELINIDLPTNEKPTNISLMNLVGAEVKNIRVSFETNRIIISLNDIPSGIYLVRTINSKGETLFTEKIVKY